MPYLLSFFFLLILTVRLNRGTRGNWKSRLGGPRWTRLTMFLRRLLSCFCYFSENLNRSRRNVQNGTREWPVIWLSEPARLLWDRTHCAAQGGLSLVTADCFVKNDHGGSLKSWSNWSFPLLRGCSGHVERVVCMFFVSRQVVVLALGNVAVIEKENV